MTPTARDLTVKLDRIARAIDLCCVRADGIDNSDRVTDAILLVDDLRAALSPPVSEAVRALVEEARRRAGCNRIPGGVGPRCGRTDLPLSEWCAPCFVEHLASALAASERRAGEMAGGVALIATERHRQIVSEEWGEAHDDEHDAGEMAEAAVCYLRDPNDRSADPTNPPADWPWAVEWWKPTPNDRVRELVKAGALIAAEIDRLQRAALATDPDGGGATG